MLLTTSNDIWELPLVWTWKLWGGTYTYPSLYYILAICTYIRALIIHFLVSLTEGVMKLRILVIQSHKYENRNFDEINTENYFELKNNNYFSCISKLTFNASVLFNTFYHFAFLYDWCNLSFPSCWHVFEGLLHVCLYINLSLLPTVFLFFPCFPLHFSSFLGQTLYFLSS